MTGEPELPIPGIDIGPLVPWPILRAELSQQQDTLETRWRLNRERREKDQVHARP
jgi:hypothetical protein